MFDGNMNDLELEDWALGIGVDASCKAYEQGWGSLTEQEKCFCVVTDLEREVYNGGFDQFFYNSSGDFAVYTVEYLLKLGAAKTARIAKDAIALFPNAKPAQDQEARWVQLREIDAKSPMAWEELDDLFYDLEEHRHLIMYEYHQKNI